MNTIELDVRGNGIKSYVMRFRANDLYFSVGVESADYKTAYDRKWSKYYVQNM